MERRGFITLPLRMVRKAMAQRKIYSLGSLPSILV